MKLHKVISDTFPDVKSEYAGVIVTPGLKTSDPCEFAWSHGQRLGNIVTDITGIPPERYYFVARVLWKYISENLLTPGVALGDLNVSNQQLSAAVYKDVTLLLGAFPTGEKSAEFVLFTPCCGTQKQFTSDAVFVTASI